MPKRQLHSFTGVERARYLSLCEELFGALASWRCDEESSEARKKCLRFVTGLRFSALLIYALRKLLLDSPLDAHWGTLLDDNNNPTRECDIVLHKRGSSIEIWNGGAAGKSDPVMDFHFVRASEARAIISCKGYALETVTDDMARYARDLQKYCPEIWLFAECCNEGCAHSVAKSAKAKGYVRFTYLYSPEDGGTANPNKGGWLEFVSAVKKLSERDRGNA